MSRWRVVVYAQPDDRGQPMFGLDTWEGEAATEQQACDPCDRGSLESEA